MIVCKIYAVSGSCIIITIICQDLLLLRRVIHATSGYAPNIHPLTHILDMSTIKNCDYRIIYVIEHFTEIYFN